MGGARGGVAWRLWSGALPFAVRSLHHPFVLNLAAGTLDPDGYRAYVAQDAFFLKAFAQAYALALSRCDTAAHIGELSSLIKGVVDEMELHKAVVRDLGVDLDTITPNAATSEYTRFLLDLAKSDVPVPVVLAAMTPCMRLYAFLGQELRRAYPMASHRFSEWLDTYASDDFEALARRIEDLLDESAGACDVGELKHVYDHAMALEYNFFDAQSCTQAPSPRGAPPGPWRLLVDFDETLTEHQTLPVIADLAADHAGDDAAKAAARSAWKTLSSRFVDKYNEALEAFLHGDGAFAARADAFAAFETRAAETSLRSKALARIPVDALRKAGTESVRLRPGAGGCLSALARKGVLDGPVHVISVNWASQLIDGCLQACLGRASVPYTVHSNTMAVDEGGLTTGDIVGEAEHVHSLRDKERVAAALHGERANAARSVYVGDSLTDVGALLRADVGIIVGTSSSLRLGLAQAGARVRPLVALACDKLLGPGARPDSRVVYEATGWPEIEIALLGDAAEPVECPPFVSPAASAQGGTGPGAPAIPVVLSAAGSDSGGGAGIQADVKTCAALGVFATTVVSGLTAQNTHGVHGVSAVAPAFISDQMSAVVEDITVHAIKTGMLPTAEAVEAVAARYEAMPAPRPPLVVDPVLVATSGDALAEASALASIRSRLIPLAHVVTPNIPEAEALLSLASGSLSSVDDMAMAAKEIRWQFGPAAVLLKGGHMGEAKGLAVDVLCHGDDMACRQIPGLRVATTNTHGTGCTLSTAIACYLARGSSLVSAVYQGKTYLTSALAGASGSCVGTGAHGPVNHAFATSPWGQQVAVGRPWGRERVREALAVYAVTDPGMSEAQNRSVVDAAIQAIHGGATVLQLRDKHNTGRLLADVLAVLPVARAAGVPVIVNDRVDVLCVGPCPLVPRGPWRSAP